MSSNASPQAAATESPKAGSNASPKEASNASPKETSNASPKSSSNAGQASNAPQETGNAGGSPHSSETSVSSASPAKMHVWAFVLDCVIILLALIDMAYVFIDAFFWSLWFQNPKWHNWTLACMRLMYLCFVVISMLLLVCGRLTEVKAVSGATLASFGFILVLFDICLVLVDGNYSATLGLVMTQVLLRICVLFFWSWVFLIFFNYKRCASKRFQPFPTRETPQPGSPFSA